MKTNFKILTLLLLLPFIGKAQSLDSFTFLGNSFDAEWNKGSFLVEGNLVLGSNALNTGMYNDVLFRPSFTQSNLDKFSSIDQKRTNFYSESNSNLELKVSKKWGVKAEFRSLRGFHSSKEMAELILFGNKPFLGSVLESENVRFINATNAVLGATQNLVSNENVQVKVGYGISLLTSYRNVQAKELSVFTAADGGYIDIVADAAEISSLTAGVQGVGIDADLDIEYKWDRSNTFVFSASNFNITRLLDNETITLDSTFRFSGLQLNLLADSVTSIQQYVDSSFNSAIDRGKQNRKWTSLPSRVQIGWKHKLNCRTDLLVQLSTVDLGDLGVTGLVGVTHEFNNNLKALSSLGYGTFQGLIWNLAGEYRFHNMSVYLGAQSLHALVVPELATNYGVSLGLSKQF